jgi:hypothetical protein
MTPSAPDEMARSLACCVVTVSGRQENHDNREDQCRCGERETGGALVSAFQFHGIYLTFKDIDP